MKRSVTLVSVFLVAFLVGSGFGYSLVNPAGYEAKISNLENEASNLKSQTSALQTEKSTLELQASECEQQIEGKDRQIAALQNQKASLQTRISDLNQQITQLQNQKSRLEQQVEARNSQISVLEKEKERIESQLSVLDQQIEAKSKEISILESQIAGLEEEVSRLEQQLEIEVLGVYFSPRGGCEDQILYWTRKANVSIHVLIYSFTLDSIGDALVEAYERGAEVRVVFEKSQVSRYSEYQRLKLAGVAVRNDTNSKLMHDKIMIIDGVIVITGSFNWSKNAENYNNENIIIIKSWYIAAIYEAEFQKIWNESV